MLGEVLYILLTDILSLLDGEEEVLPAESGDDLDGLVLAAVALERREEALGPTVEGGSQ